MPRHPKAAPAIPRAGDQPTNLSPDALHAATLAGVMEDNAKPGAPMARALRTPA